MATTLVSLPEYLGTDCRPDCDYVDGEIEERNAGQKIHSAVQSFFIAWLALHKDEWKMVVLPELRMQVSTTPLRVVDIAILRIDEPYEPGLTRPPLAVVEVLSPDAASAATSGVSMTIATWGFPACG